MRSLLFVEQQKNVEFAPCGAVPAVAADTRTSACVGCRDLSPSSVSGVRGDAGCVGPRRAGAGPVPRATTGSGAVRFIAELLVVVDPGCVDSRSNEV